MDSIIETLSITVSLVTLFLIPAVLLTISYLIRRNGFYISVNCWFCNGWTKVLFAERNSFYCPSCLQYNGFNEDGGYNKVIEEQFDTSFNKHKTIGQSGLVSSNGLCAYCNNNQQLKIRQLANFVPLNEKNYDVEVEHFRAQLEKSYKLCKKCDRVLKKTIERQYAWIFGNRIKNLQNKASHLLNLNKSKKFYGISMKSISMNFIRYTIILVSLIVLSQALNSKINYPKSTIKEYLPDISMPYTVLLNDWCHIVSNATDNLIKNMSSKFNFHLTSDLKDVRIIKNDILPITWFGLILEIILLTWQPKSALWKVNELLGWIILIITSLNTFHDDYFEYINAVQILCSIAVIYSILLTSNPEGKEVPKKKFTFKKLKTKADKAESSDEEICEDTLNSSFCSNKSFSGKSCQLSNSFNASHYQPSSQNLIFRDLLQNTANTNDTFVTARSTKGSSVFNSSFKNGSINSSSNELHRSLDNLHLSNLSFKSQSCTSPVFSVNSVSRPILSPPKLKNITQNSWTAGGFWKNDVTAFPTSTDVTNLSRSSSQSSGFVSSNDPVVPNTYNSLPPSREPSLYGDFEKASILSEPTYHFTPINSGSGSSQSRNNFLFNNSHISKPCSSKASQLYYKSDNIFYPILKQNNMLLVQGNDIPRFNFENSFSNLSLKNFNTNRFNTPVLFGEKPIISSLFKNLQGANTQSHMFRAPHC